MKPDSLASLGAVALILLLGLPVGLSVAPATLAGCPRPPAPCGGGTGQITVTGTVTDGVSGAVIQSAGVLAVYGFFQQVRTTTDSRGYYTFTVPALSVAITVSKSGYQDAQASVKSVVGGTFVRDILMYVVPPPVVKYDLDVYVLAGDSPMPVRAENVVVTGNGVSLTETTDANGHAGPWLLPAGTYMISVNPFYSKNLQPGNTTVDLTQGSVTVTLRLQPVGGSTTGNPILGVVRAALTVVLAAGAVAFAWFGPGPWYVRVFGSSLLAVLAVLMLAGFLL